MVSAASALMYVPPTTSDDLCLTLCVYPFSMILTVGWCAGGAGPVRPQQGGHALPPPGEEVDHLDLQKRTGGPLRPLQQSRGLHRQVSSQGGPLRPLQQYRGLHKKDSSQGDYSDPSNNPEDYTDRSVVKGTTQTSPTIQRTTQTGQ